jgi:hypothetical protein
MRQNQSKTVYPMCMKFIKIDNQLPLCVFALVADVAIYTIHQGGNSKVFTHLSSIKIAVDEQSGEGDYLPTCMEVAEHETTKKLIVCLSVQSA